MKEKVFVMPYKQRVGGSNPSTPTKEVEYLIRLFFILEAMFFVYILYSEKLHIYYVGSTKNLEDRLNRHNSGRSIYTKPGIPWKLVYRKEYATRSEAYQAELYIKAQKSKHFIESLIRGTHLLS